MDDDFPGCDLLTNYLILVEKKSTILNIHRKIFLLLAHSTVKKKL